MNKKLYFNEFVLGYFHLVVETDQTIVEPSVNETPQSGNSGRTTANASSESTTGDGSQLYAKEIAQQIMQNVLTETSEANNSSDPKSTAEIPESVQPLVQLIAQILARTVRPVVRDSAQTNETTSDNFVLAETDQEESTGSVNCDRHVNGM